MASEGREREWSERAWCREVWVMVEKGVYRSICFLWG